MTHIQLLGARAALWASIGVTLVLLAGSTPDLPIRDTSTEPVREPVRTQGFGDVVRNPATATEPRLARVPGDAAFGVPALPPAIPPEDGGCPVAQEGEGLFCTQVMTGTTRARYRITNPNGFPGLSDISLHNFEQKVVGSGPGYLDVEVASRLWVDTRAGYPVDRASLPPSQLAYLQPAAGVQSDHPEIVALAGELVAGTAMQAEAVERVLTWVRSHIMYDFTFSYPNDAVSVLRNRTGVCAGFAALSTALLRAGGIPAQYVLGCATPFGYSTGPGGGFHGWVAAYYQDVGWVHSEPQVSANYLLPGAFIGEEGDLSYLAWCGNEATRIEQISVETNVPSGLWLRTPYPNGITDWSFIHAASIPAWRR